MKVALAILNNRISPVFDVSQNILILDIAGQQINGKQLEKFDNDNPHRKVSRLFELGVKDLICGAVSAELAGLLENCGIRTIPFIAGEVEEVISAYLDKQLLNSVYKMPGFPGHA